MLNPGFKYHSTLEDLAKLPKLEAMFENIIDDEGFRKFYDETFLPGHKKDNSGKLISCYKCLDRVSDKTYVAITVTDSDISETTFNFHEGCYNGLVFQNQNLTEGKK